ncbi:hypothetical protein SSX86_022709 [Deinandra increscens subsp. villosa]|uniref:TFIIS N-terminal domain-containing protein n=1 Tax=Deinandra increscens subsp. villosa TaxID=3103831 RepID=A0AAP0GSR5_9ASTR
MDELMRNCLQNFNGDIFEMIKSAIMVAASDHPQEFRQKRDMIAQTLFSSGELTKGRENCNLQSIIINDDIVGGVTGETKIVAEVLKMKAILERSSHESESVLLNSLSKLQHMVKSVDVLKLTGIGKSVNALRDHGSKNVAIVSRKLVKEWRCMVDGWIIKDAKKIPPPKIEKQQIVPRNNQESRPMVVRIKLKKDHTEKESSVALKPTGLNTETKTAPKNNGKDACNVEEKLKAAKQKLREAYEEAEKLRKKRRIQVIQFHELSDKKFPPSK